MTASPQLIGIIAGLVAAVLFTSLSTNTFLAIALFYLTPLPVLLAGVGWGTLAAQLAFMTATVLISLIVGMKFAILFVFAIGLPGLILSYLALLHRIIPPQAPSGQPQADAPAIEWYPPGRIIAWAAVMAGIVIAAGIALGGDGEHYRRVVKAMFDPQSLKTVQALIGSEKDPAKLDHFIEMFGRFILPVSLSATWLLVMLGNVWLAAKSAAISGQLTRPWPAFTTLEYPPLLMVAFLIAVGIGMLPNQLGIMAMALVGAFGLAYAIMGLTVIHVAVPDTPLKPVILAGIYMGILVALWIFVPILILLGLGESVFELRRRALERSTPPNGMAGPNS